MHNQKCLVKTTFLMAILFSVLPLSQATASNSACNCFVFTDGLSHWGEKYKWRMSIVSEEGQEIQVLTSSTNWNSGTSAYAACREAGNGERAKGNCN